MTGIRSALLAVSLVVAGAIGAVLLHAPPGVIYAGIAMTIGAVCVAIGSSGRTTCHCPDTQQLEQALAAERDIYLNRIRACADCPICLADIHHEKEIGA